MHLWVTSVKVQQLTINLSDASPINQMASKRLAEPAFIHNLSHNVYSGVWTNTAYYTIRIVNNLLSDRLQYTLYRLRVKDRHACDLQDYCQSEQSSILICLHDNHEQIQGYDYTSDTHTDGEITSSRTPHTLPAQPTAHTRRAHTHTRSQRRHCVPPACQSNSWASFWECARPQISSPNSFFRSGCPSALCRQQQRRPTGAAGAWSWQLQSTLIRMLSSVTL